MATYGLTEGQLTSRIHYRAQEDIEDVEEGKADKSPKAVMRQLSA
jgi:hypothetical protein